MKDAKGHGSNGRGSRKARTAMVPLGLQKSLADAVAQRHSPDNVLGKNDTTYHNTYGEPVFNSKRISDAENAMHNLQQTFHTGQNKYGEYGRNTREAFDRHAKLHAELTGKPQRHIYDR